MKKLPIAFLALLMLFAFAACTDKTTDTPSVETEQGETQSGEAERPCDTEQPNDNEPDETEPDNKEITTMYIYINDNKLEVTLAKNSSTDALAEILKKGDIIYTADDYGGFEKVGDLGRTLPTENSRITTQAGDVILYSGNQIVLFYGSNTWSYTRLGKINGYSASELRALLGAGKGSARVRISLK